jgi:hypothetical protein
MTFRPLLLACLLSMISAPPVLGAPSTKPARVKATPAPTKRKATRLSRGQRVARRASRLVGTSLVGQGVPDDCSGLARLAYRGVGIELLSLGSRPGENAASAMYRRAQRRGALHQKTPRPGDLVFFRETYDRNRDGVRNDGLTHVGVIESVGRDGTVIFVHRGGQGVSRARMNLRHAAAPRARDGRVLNDYLRRAEDGERGRLTGELFAGYASAARL